MWFKSVKLYLYFEEAVALFLNVMLLVDLVRMLIPESLNVVILFMQALLYGIGFGYMVLLVYWKRSINRYLLLFIMSSGMVCLGSLILEPKIIQFYPYFIFSFFLRYIPSIYYMLELRNFEKLFEAMKKYICIWLLYAIIGIWYVPLHTPNGYSMTFGYNLFFALGFLFVYLYKEKKIHYLVCEIIILGAVVLRGSRGIILCFGVFAVLSLMVEILKKLTIQRSFALLLSSLAVLIAVFNINYILKLASIILPNSRTLMLLSDNLTFDSGRSSIQDIFNYEISKNIFAVRGIFSDRIFFTEKQTGVAYSITNYPHSFICEVFFQYGLLIATVFLLFLLYGTMKSMKIVRIQSMEIIAIFYMLLSIGVIQLFFSNSYLISYTFFMYIGIMIRVITTGRNYNDKSITPD